MASFLAIGECMMELRENNDSSFRRAFSGDTYNSAVYAKRWSPDLKVALYSSIGQDPLSDAMLEQWKTDGLDTSLVTRAKKALLGIYVIATDPLGERSFSYWRRDSAASQMMNLLEKKHQHRRALSFNCVYFSGITLAILSVEQRVKLLQWLEQLRANGADIAFDPNYRANLWDSPQQAVRWIEEAYKITDIALPGLDEHTDLFAHQTIDDVQSYLSGLGVKEIIIKSGQQGIYAFSQGNPLTHLPFSAAPKQVDSTAAGDSFSGTYLASRIEGAGVQESITSAARVASLVVQHSGAVICERIYNHHIKKDRGSLNDSSSVHRQ